MKKNIPVSRAEAYALLKEYTVSPALLYHAKAVEAVMIHMARKFGAEAETEKWAVVGLVHDLDYEKFPSKHCHKVREILEAKQWPEEYIRAVESHGWGLCSDVKPISPIEKCLYAVDELTGLVTACALVRPSRSVHDLKPKSLRKKWKQLNFAAGVNRDVIQKGADMLGMELNELFEDVIAGMRTLTHPIP